MDNSFHIIVVRITCLTNHMGCISRHITTLVINSLEGGDTHTQTYRCPHRNSFKRSRKPTCGWCTPGLKISLLIYSGITCTHVHIFDHIL